MSQTLMDQHSRRSFLKQAALFVVSLPPAFVFTNFCQASSEERELTARPRIGGYCENCEGIYEGMPERLDWHAAIAAPAEPGERLTVSGVIYKLDGQTPARDVILYVYHTDVNGYYSPAPEATGITRRHGHLRGWVKTNDKGEYRFDTIRPAAYPGRSIPAHIHAIVKEPGKNEYFIEDYTFQGDPLLTPQELARYGKMCGSGVMRVEKNSSGIWTGRRDLILGLNVTNYYV